MQGQVVVDRGRLELDRHMRIDEQGGELRSEGEALVVRVEVEGLLAESVARAEERLAARVPDGEGEHADQVVEAALASVLIESEQHLRVRARAEAVALRLEPGAQLEEVVDLAVEGEHRSGRSHHRLVRLGSEVEDRQAAVAEADTAVEVDAARIGTTVGEPIGHLVEDARIDAALPVEVDLARDAAHGVRERRGHGERVQTTRSGPRGSMGPGSSTGVRRRGRTHAVARPTSDDRIAPTAHYTAWVWHRLGLPHADLYATAQGAAVFWGMRLLGEWMAAMAPGVPSMTRYLERRHLLIDRALEAHGPDRIVEIGAGLSRRGTSWAADQGVPYVEIDLPAMIAVKTALLAERAPETLRLRLAGRLRLIEGDALDPGFEAVLRRELAGAHRPAIVAEGVLGYFTPGQRARLAARVRQALGANGGIFLSDLRTREGHERMPLASRGLRAGIGLLTRGRGAGKEIEDDEAVRALFREAGFEQAAPVDIAALAPELLSVPSPGTVWQAHARPEAPAAPGTSLG